MKNYLKLVCVMVFNCFIISSNAQKISHAYINSEKPITTDTSSSYEYTNDLGGAGDIVQELDPEFRPSFEINILIDDLNLGIASNLMVYPVSNNNDILLVEDILQRNDADIELYSISRNEFDFKVVTLMNGISKIDLSGLSKGNYILNVYNSDNEKQSFNIFIIR